MSIGFRIHATAPGTQAPSFPTPSDSMGHVTPTIPSTTQMIDVASLDQRVNGLIDARFNNVLMTSVDSRIDARIQAYLPQLDQRVSSIVDKKIDELVKKNNLKTENKKDVWSDRLWVGAKVLACAGAGAVGVLAYQNIWGEGKRK